MNPVGFGLRVQIGQKRSVEPELLAPKLITEAIEVSEELTSESMLAGAALALGADTVCGFSPEEAALADAATKVSPRLLVKLRASILEGEDPLGNAFSLLRSPEVRRESGATYTPTNLVRAMLSWAADERAPDRVVDPGTGSARFLSAAGRTFKKSQLVGLELDPLAALLGRANLATLGFAKRSRIDLVDYRLKARRFDGQTLFIGNPPYVRHHQIEPTWKRWLVETAEKHNFKASQLAGLHVYFYLATVQHASPGDRGAFITAAEWMDVNYGQLVRDLFLGPLGGQSIVVMEPTASPFPDAATTGAITTFKIGSTPRSVRVRRVKRMKDLQDLQGGRSVRRERLEAETRWSRLTHASRSCPEGFVELGEICRVHRGTVTGANAVFIANSESAGVPERFKLPTVTKAKELIAAGRVLSDSSFLRSVVDLPDDLDELEPHERAGVEQFLLAARARGAHEGYVARNRRAWWSVGLRAAAPILTTYMARRAPSFVRNMAEARHINIAHGLYPRDPLTEEQMTKLVEYLSTGISVMDGRTYAGGLTKFEPGEMERLYVPSPSLLKELNP